MRRTIRENGSYYFKIPVTLELEPHEVATALTLYLWNNNRNIFPAYINKLSVRNYVTVAVEVYGLNVTSALQQHLDDEKSESRKIQLTAMHVAAVNWVSDHFNPNPSDFRLQVKRVAKKAAKRLNKEGE